MKKIKEIMREVARSAASTYAFAALAIMSATTAVASLPSGYVECEFIQGNGSNARIVIDDYTPNPSTDKIEAVVSFPAGTLNQTQTIWCSRGKTTTTATWTLFVLNSSGYKFRLDYGSTAGTAVTPALSATDVKYTVTADGNVFTWSGGNGQTHTADSAFTAAGGPLMLFASYYNGTGNNLGNYGKHKLYSFKVWRSGALIHNLVPVVRVTDSKPGLYDVSGDKFYPGTGAFTYGTIINRFAISTIANCYVSPDELAGGVEPEVRVYDYTTSSWLVLGRDYTVSYQDNTSRGAAKAVATGKGNYAGESAEVSFVIVCVKMVSADYSLSADEDWTNYDFVSIASGVTIDLNGHNMTISGLDGSGTVTDSVGGGELHCAIPASYLGGYQAAITNVTLKGKLTLVKEGPGVLTAIKEGQAYTGGTVVNAGTLKYGCGNKSAFEAYPFGQISHKKDQGHITINAGGVLDPGGAQAWNCHTLIINGGMISNTVAGGNMTYGIFNPKTTVNGDFTFATTQDFGWTVRGELGGHTGTVDIATGKYMYVGTASTDPPLAEGGRIVLTGGGYLRTLSGDRTNFFNTVDLEMTNGALWLESNMIVHDYTPAPVNKGKGSAELNVLGTFTPASDYFYGPTMQNSSAIDLSAKTDAWSVTSLLTDGGNATTKFAADATVTVILGERKCKVGDKVISWTTAPDSTVSFTSKRATFESRSDGLYITEWKGSGLSIFVR